MSDPAFTGFYRIEYGLWHGQGARQLDGPAAKLDRDVLALRRFWPGMEIDLLDLGLRTHEILENALEFQLTGHDDYGSGTTLATTAANITGTRELLTVLRPLLVAALPGPARGVRGAGPAGQPARGGRAARRPLDAGARAGHGPASADRRRRRAGPAGTRPDRGHHRAAEVMMPASGDAELQGEGVADGPAVNDPARNQPVAE